METTPYCQGNIITRGYKLRKQWFTLRVPIVLLFTRQYTDGLEISNTPTF